MRDCSYSAGMILDAETTKQLAKEEFEAWARTYDRSLLNYFLFQPSSHMFLEELAHWHKDHATTFDILDIGCGTGTFLAMIAASSLPARSLVGLDYAMEMCLQASKKAGAAGVERMPFIHGDSEHLPFADSSFDIVTCANSFHHYPNQQAVVREMRRVLRPGGRLMIIDGFRDNVIGWVMFDVIITTIEKSVYHAPATIMRDYFAEAGLVNVHQRKFNLLFPAFVTVGAVEA